jgi:hypothetical protein
MTESLIRRDPDHSLHSSTGQIHIIVAYYTSISVSKSQRQSPADTCLFANQPNHQPTSLNQAQSWDPSSPVLEAPPEDADFPSLSSRKPALLSDCYPADLPSSSFSNDVLDEFSFPFFASVDSLDCASDPSKPVQSPCRSTSASGSTENITSPPTSLSSNHITSPSASISSQTNTSPSSQRVFHCSDCAISFTRKSDLKRHQSSSTSGWPCAVKSCRKLEKLYPRKDKCLAHMRAAHLRYFNKGGAPLKVSRPSGKGSACRGRDEH